MARSHSIQTIAITSSRMCSTWHEIFRTNAVNPHFSGPPVLPSYTVSTLPSSPGAGAKAFASNGRKPNEAQARSRRRGLLRRQPLDLGMQWFAGRSVNREEYDARLAAVSVHDRQGSGRRLRPICPRRITTTQRSRQSTPTAPSSRPIRRSPTCRSRHSALSADECHQVTGLNLTGVKLAVIGSRAQGAQGRQPVHHQRRHMPGR